MRNIKTFFTESQAFLTKTALLVSLTREEASSLESLHQEVNYRLKVCLAENRLIEIITEMEKAKQDLAAVTPINEGYKKFQEELVIRQEKRVLHIQGYASELEDHGKNISIWEERNEAILQECKNKIVTAEEKSKLNKEFKSNKLKITEKTNQLLKTKEQLKKASAYFEEMSNGLKELQNNIQEKQILEDRIKKLETTAEKACAELNKLSHQHYHEKKLKENIFSDLLKQLKSERRKPRSYKTLCKCDEQEKKDLRIKLEIYDHLNVQLCLLYFLSKEVSENETKNVLNYLEILGAPRDYNHYLVCYTEAIRRHKSLEFGKFFVESFDSKMPKVLIQAFYLGIIDDELMQDFLQTALSFAKNLENENNNKQGEAEDKNTINIETLRHDFFTIIQFICYQKLTLDEYADDYAFYLQEISHYKSFVNNAEDIKKTRVAIDNVASSSEERSVEPYTDEDVVDLCNATSKLIRYSFFKAVPSLASKIIQADECKEKFRINSEIIKNKLVGKDKEVFEAVLNVLLNNITSENWSEFFLCLKNVIEGVYDFFCRKNNYRTVVLLRILLEMIKVTMLCDRSHDGNLQLALRDYCYLEDPIENSCYFQMLEVYVLYVLCDFALMEHNSEFKYNTDVIVNIKDFLATTQEAVENKSDFNYLLNTIYEAFKICEAIEDAGRGNSLVLCLYLQEMKKKMYLLVQDYFFKTTNLPSKIELQKFMNDLDMYSAHLSVVLSRYQSSGREKSYTDYLCYFINGIMESIFEEVNAKLAQRAPSSSSSMPTLESTVSSKKKKKKKKAKVETKILPPIEVEKPEVLIPEAKRFSYFVSGFSHKKTTQKDFPAKLVMGGETYVLLRFHKSMGFYGNEKQKSHADNVIDKPHEVLLMLQGKNYVIHTPVLWNTKTNEVLYEQIVLCDIRDMKNLGVSAEAMANLPFTYENEAPLEKSNEEKINKFPISILRNTSFWPIVYREFDENTVEKFFENFLKRPHPSKASFTQDFFLEPKVYGLWLKYYKDYAQNPEESIYRAFKVVTAFLITNFSLFPLKGVEAKTPLESFFFYLYTKEKDIFNFLLKQAPLTEEIKNLKRLLPKINSHYFLHQQISMTDENITSFAEGALESAIHKRLQPLEPINALFRKEPMAILETVFFYRKGFAYPEELNNDLQRFWPYSTAYHLQQCNITWKDFYSRLNAYTTAGYKFWTDLWESTHLQLLIFNCLVEVDIQGCFDYLLENAYNPKNDKGVFFDPIFVLAAFWSYVKVMSNYALHERLKNPMFYQLKGFRSEEGVSFTVKAQKAHNDFFKLNNGQNQVVFKRPEIPEEMKVETKTDENSSSKIHLTQGQ